MRLLPNWRQIVRHAWSLRLIVIAGLFSAAEVALPLAKDVVPVPTGVFALLSAAATAGAFWSRLVVQKKISGSDA
jgi:hypothetical protein